MYCYVRNENMALHEGVQEISWDTNFTVYVSSKVIGRDPVAFGSGKMQIHKQIYL